MALRLCQRARGFEFALLLGFTFGNLTLLKRIRRIEKSFLARVQGVRMQCRPFARLRQVSPAIQRTRIAFEHNLVILFKGDNGERSAFVARDHQ